MRAVRYLHEWLTDCLESITPTTILISIIGVAVFAIAVIWQAN